MYLISIQAFKRFLTKQENNKTYCATCCCPLSLAVNYGIVVSTAIISHVVAVSQQRAAASA